LPLAQPQTRRELLPAGRFLGGPLLRLHLQAHPHVGPGRLHDPGHQPLRPRVGQYPLDVRLLRHSERLALLAQHLAQARKNACNLTPTGR